MPIELPGARAAYEVLDPSEVEEIRVIGNRYPNGKSAVLPALWILQHKEGVVTAAGMRDVARALEIPPGPVEAVASFYSMFFFKPHGRYVVEMCTNMSCMLLGAGPLLRRLETKLGVPSGGTTEENLATLLEVECLGACGGAPAAQVNHRFFENLTDEKVDELVDDMRAGKLEVSAAPGAGGAVEPVAELSTGQEAAAPGAEVDLIQPGANRMPLPARGAAGNVVDLVKGRGNLTAASHHPAERGYEDAPPVAPAKTAARRRTKR